MNKQNRKITHIEVTGFGLPKLRPAPDAVTHPAHYTQGSVECIDAIESALGLVGFCEYLRGQVIKYTWRMSSKGNALQDGQKAQWYQNLLVRKLEEAANICKDEGCPQSAIQHVCVNNK